MSRKSCATGVMMIRWCCALALGGVMAMLAVPRSGAQSVPAPPVNGMRPADLRTHAITNAKIVVKPGTVLENAAILIRDGVIAAVGPDVEIPDGVRVWNAEGKTIYPGLIEPALLIKPAVDPPRSAGSHWNAKVHPEWSMNELPAPEASLRKELRGMGFTTAAVYPNAGALRGSGVVIALGDADDQVLAYRPRAAMLAAFDYGGFGGGGGGGGGGYPGSLMGAIALLRQTFYDAQWHSACRRIWQEDSVGHEPPVRADALEALADVMDRRQPLLMEVSDELNALRAVRMAKEFNLNLALLGSGTEFRRLDEIIAAKTPLIIPLEFGKRPDVSTINMADAVSLRDLQTWEQAPTNPRRLIAAAPEGTVALTTHKLKSRGEFHSNLRSAIKHGLTEDQALAALTITPARMLGIDNLVGTIEAGKAANLIVVKGSLFDKEGKIYETWVNGRRSEFASDALVELKGSGVMNAAMEPAREFKVDFDSGKSSLTLKWGAEDKEKTSAKKVIVQQDQVSAVIDGRPFDAEGYVQLSGVMQGETIRGTGMLPNGSTFPFTITITPKGEGDEAPEAEGEKKDDEGDRANPQAGGGGAEAKDPVTGTWTMQMEGGDEDMTAVSELKLTGTAVTGQVGVMGQSLPLLEGTFDPATGKVAYTITGPTGAPTRVEATITGGSMAGTIASEAFSGNFTGSREGAAAGEADGKGRGKNGKDEDTFTMPPEQINHPFGEYGMAEPNMPQDMIFTNATIWTSGEKGIIQNGWMLVRGGKIEAVGDSNPPKVSGTVGLMNCEGKHITAGLIDCHSHTGVDGSVNEGSQSNTAEVRIGDCIDPDDINWYRELAGGLTACNQLHGSANVIGGQNSVVKLKWGRSADDFRIADAIPGIKFALGENVKRSNNRYPNTRMGVEQWLRDAFTAAREYKARWDRHLALPNDQRSTTMPPRRDLELDALVEILNKERLVHCHSYRQDEILMLVRVAEDFGFTIGTFQHVLEGYKVAEAIAAHGAGASSFSDWWAYKIEVIDAIPYNGSLMTNVGVLTSFNSDSDELARRMNTEAAKAVRYGGLTPEEALKFVTINPAQQLRIDHRTGSLEAGKDADFAIWSGNPLSTYTRCEQTWIEGAKYFDIETDRKLRDEIRAERQRLIQKILTQAHGKLDKEGEATTKPETQPDASSESAPDADRPRRRRPPNLLARMLEQQQEAWVIEQFRLGRDPEDIRPGDCGCGMLFFTD